MSPCAGHEVQKMATSCGRAACRVSRSWLEKYSGASGARQERKVGAGSAGVTVTVPMLVLDFVHHVIC